MTPLSYSDAFLAFWSNYPWRSKKADAYKAFQQQGLTMQDVPMLLEALAWQKQTPQWTRDGGRYVPLPATWLRARSFEDEPFEPPTAVAEIRDTKTSRIADAARGLAQQLGTNEITTDALRRVEGRSPLFKRGLGLLVQRNSGGDW